MIGLACWSRYLSAATCNVEGSHLRLFMFCILAAHACRSYVKDAYAVIEHDGDVLGTLSSQQVVVLTRVFFVAI
jgi:hypothetical protein